MRTLPRNSILSGDALLRLQSLPGGSVDCVVTSPPYFALRDYGVAGQLGAEADVQAWVTNLRAVLREVARVLVPGGTVWLNVGDSFSRGNRWGAAAKSLLLGPERLLVGLADDGWIVRNKIVWAKANPMPSSVRDRLAMSWEPVFLLTRSRQYFFDLDAVRVPHSARAKGRGKPLAPGGGRPVWAGPLAGDQGGLEALKAQGLQGHPLGKNPGDVWRVATSNFRGPHFATFPEALVRPMVTAGCPIWTCSHCQRAWVRQPVQRSLGHLAVLGELRPGCSCRAERRPGVVLDPFLGAGTVAVVAEALGRDWVGIELNPAFVTLAHERLDAARQRQARKENNENGKEVMHG